MLKRFIINIYIVSLLSLQLAHSPAWALDAPTLVSSISGTELSLSWNAVPNATSYTLYYAPSPYAGEQTIGQLDMGVTTEFSATLWEGAAYYVAVVAKNGSELSTYSNTAHFTIEQEGRSENPTYLQLNCTGGDCYWFENSMTMPGENTSAIGTWQQVSSNGREVSWHATWTFSEGAQARYDFYYSSGGGCYKTFSSTFTTDTFELLVIDDTCGNDEGNLYSGSYTITSDILDITNYVEDVSIFRDADTPEIAFAFTDNAYILTIQIGNEVGLAEYGSLVISQGTYFMFPVWKLEGDLVARAAAPMGDCMMETVATGNLLYDQSCPEYQLTPRQLNYQNLPLSFYQALANIMHFGTVSEDTSATDTGSGSTSSSGSSQSDISRVITQNNNTYNAYGYAGFFN